jgi:leucyl aminopeptidase
VKISSIKADITTVESEALIVNLFEDVKIPGGATGSVDSYLGGKISKLITAGEITGKKNEITIIHTFEEFSFQRVIICGLGKQEKFNYDSIRQIMAITLRYLRKIKVKKVTSICHGAGIGGLDPQLCTLAMTEGSLLGIYKFDKYKKSSPEETLEELLIVDSNENNIKPIDSGITKGTILAESTIIARDLGNEPGNILPPRELAVRTNTFSKAVGLDCKIFEKLEIQKMGMGGILGVSAGSHEDPRFIVMEHKGNNNSTEKIALCGKGITFDTGGISLKPPLNMGAMKGDMAGAAAVIGAMIAIKKLNLPINVLGVVASAENMPGGSAMRPGDIITMMNGKHIEVDNTDAEGRLVLADAIEYSKQQGCTSIIDVATLTGAAIVALGNNAAAIMGNDQNLMDKLLATSEYTGEHFWQLPLFENYATQLDSIYADMKNTGGQPAGSITAGKFLQDFVGDTPWMHLDIAGMARLDSTKDYKVAGHTGFPVRSLVSLINTLAE